MRTKRKLASLKVNHAVEFLKISARCVGFALTCEVKGEAALGNNFVEQLRDPLFLQTLLAVELICLNKANAFGRRGRDEDEIGRKDVVFVDLDQVANFEVHALFFAELDVSRELRLLAFVLVQAGLERHLNRLRVRDFVLFVANHVLDSFSDHAGNEHEQQRRNCCIRLERGDGPDAHEDCHDEKVQVRNLGELKDKAERHEVEFVVLGRADVVSAENCLVLVRLLLYLFGLQAVATSFDKLRVHSEDPLSVPFFAPLATRESVENFLGEISVLVENAASVFARTSVGRHRAVV